MMSTQYNDGPTMYEKYIPGLKSKCALTKGYRAVYSRLSVSSKFYDSTIPNFSQYIDSSWESAQSKYIPIRFMSKKQAREFCADFTPPKDILHHSRVLSREMVRELYQNGGTPRIERYMPNGHFDGRAMRRVMTDIHANRFSVETTLPFKQRPRLNPSRPHVGICADGSWRAFWNDSTYVPRVMALMMGITWAAEAIGCPATCAFTRGNSHASPGVRLGTGYGVYDMSASLVSSPDIRLNTSDLSVGFHPELYRIGDYAEAVCNIHNIRLRFNNPNITEDEAKTHGCRDCGNEGSSDGGQGVSFIQSFGANVTVAIGDVKDKENATITISPDTSLEEAIKKIAQTVGNQLRTSKALEMEMAI